MQKKKKKKKEKKKRKKEIVYFDDKLKGSLYTLIWYQFHKSKLNTGWDMIDFLCVMCTVTFQYVACVAIETDGFWLFYSELCSWLAWESFDHGYENTTCNVYFFDLESA